MRMMIESTSRIVDVNGVPARVWEGATESGVEVVVLVTRIAAVATQDLTQFEQELQVTRPPSAAAEYFPLRMVL